MIINKEGWKRFLIIISAFSFYSISSVFSKKASFEIFLSVDYCEYLLGVLSFLAIYAILWQKILSFMDLNKAYLCKSITIVFILIISWSVFDESVSIQNIIGVIIIIFGLLVLAWKG